MSKLEVCILKDERNNLKQNMADMFFASFHNVTQLTVSTLLAYMIYSQQFLFPYILFIIITLFVSLSYYT